MPYKRARRTRNKRPGRKAYKKTYKLKRSMGKKTSVKAVVERVLSRNVEVKSFAPVEVKIEPLYPVCEGSWGMFGDPFAGYTKGSLTALLFNPLAQGSSDATRIGDKIQLKSAHVVGYVTAAVTGGETPVNSAAGYVKIILLRLKKFPQTAPWEIFPDAPPPLGPSNIFQNGPTDAAASGGFYDLENFYNKEAYTVLESVTLKVGPSITVGSSFANNDFASVRRFSFNLAKHLPSKLIYNSINQVQTASTVQNAALYLAAFATTARGLPYKSQDQSNAPTAFQSGEGNLAIQYLLKGTYTDS